MGRIEQGKFSTHEFGEIDSHRPDGITHARN